MNIIPSFSKKDFIGSLNSNLFLDMEVFCKRTLPAIFILIVIKISVSEATHSLKIFLRKASQYIKNRHKPYIAKKDYKEFRDFSEAAGCRYPDVTVNYFGKHFITKLEGLVLYAKYLISKSEDHPLHGVPAKDILFIYNDSYLLEADEIINLVEKEGYDITKTGMKVDTKIVDEYVSDYIEGQARFSSRTKKEEKVNLHEKIFIVDKKHIISAIEQVIGESFNYKVSVFETTVNNMRDLHKTLPEKYPDIYQEYNSAKLRNRKIYIMDSLSFDYRTFMIVPADLPEKEKEHLKASKGKLSV